MDNELKLQAAKATIMESVTKTAEEEYPKKEQFRQYN